MLSDFMEYLLPEMNMDRHAINIETLFKAKVNLNVQKLVKSITHFRNAE